MLTNDYFQILKRAHDHPKLRNFRFTPEQKIEILWKLAKQYRPIEQFNKDLNLPWNSLNIFNKELNKGTLGLGNGELIQALAERTDKVKRKLHLMKTTKE